MKKIKFWTNDQEALDELYNWMNFSMRFHDNTTLSFVDDKHLRISNPYLTKTFYVKELNAELTYHKYALNLFECWYKQIKYAITTDNKLKVINQANNYVVLEEQESDK